MLAIIPARGGSKGLPGKNIKLLGGIPLIAHTILAAKKSELISRIVVSTDSEKIKQIALKHGAEVPYKRPKKLASDQSMVMDAYIHMLEFISDKSENPVESFIALLPTVPFREASDIDNAINLFYKKTADSVISVTKSRIPIDWHRVINKDGKLKSYLPEFTAINNRQTSECTYLPNGAIYVFNSKKLSSERQYYFENTYPYIMPVERSIDIDSEFDFEFAEYIYNKKNHV